MKHWKILVKFVRSAKLLDFPRLRTSNLLNFSNWISYYRSTFSRLHFNVRMFYSLLLLSTEKRTSSPFDSHYYHPLIYFEHTKGEWQRVFHSIHPPKYYHDHNHYYLCYTLSLSILIPSDEHIALSFTEQMVYSRGQFVRNTQLKGNKEIFETQMCGRE